MFNGENYYIPRLLPAQFLLKSAGALASPQEPEALAEQLTPRLLSQVIWNLETVYGLCWDLVFE